MSWKYRKLFLKAQEALDANDLAKAEEGFLGLISENSDRPDALLHLAFTRFRMGKLDEALGDIDRAIGLRAENGVMHMIRGEILLEQKRVLEAYDALKKSCELEKDNGRAIYGLGRAAKLLGRRHEASDYFEQALQFERDYCLAQQMADDARA